jgi:Lon protease-like protein
MAAPRDFVALPGLPGARTGATQSGFPYRRRPVSAPARRNHRTVWLVPASPSDKTDLLPLFPLGTVLVPDMRLSLHVFEPRYRQLVADLLGTEDPAAPVFGVVALRQGFEVGELSDVFEVGTTARVTDVLPHSDGRCDLSAIGETRFVIRSLDTVSRPYLVATVSYLPEEDGDVRPGSAAHVRRTWAGHVAAINALQGEPDATLSIPVDARALSYAVAEFASLPLADRQELLASADTAQRLNSARSILRRESELLRLLHAVPATASAFQAGLGSS